MSGTQQERGCTPAVGFASRHHLPPSHFHCQSLVSWSQRVGRGCSSPREEPSKPSKAALSSPEPSLLKAKLYPHSHFMDSLYDPSWPGALGHSGVQRGKGGQLTFVGKAPSTNAHPDHPSIRPRIYPSPSAYPSIHPRPHAPTHSSILPSTHPSIHHSLMLPCSWPLELCPQGVLV